MGKHSVPHGEEGTMTSRTSRGASEKYVGQHREDVASGSSGQQRTTKSDVPPRGEGV